MPACLLPERAGRMDRCFPYFSTLLSDSLCIYLAIRYSLFITPPHRGSRWRGQMATKKAKPEQAKQEPVVAPVVITAYKGFDKNLVCSPNGKPFQFEIGKTYEHEGKVEACSSGFHACENPLDVFSYYSPADSRFCSVELSGEFSRHEDDSKIAAGKITIKAEIGIPEIVTAAIKWVVALCGDAQSGDYSTNAQSGYYSKNAQSGYYSKNAQSGYYSKNAQSGYYSKNAQSGNSSTNAQSGDYSTNAQSGYYSKNAQSGDYSTNAQSGYSSTNAQSGYSSTNAQSGYSSTNAQSGNSSTNAQSGDYSTSDVTGKYGVSVAAGKQCKAKAGEGGCFALRWDDADRPRITVCYVGENGIKPDVFYTLNDKGEAVEAQS